MITNAIVYQNPQVSNTACGFLNIFVKNTNQTQRSFVSLLQRPKGIHQSGLAGGFFVLHLDDLRGAACYHRIGRHIANHDGACRHNRVMANTEIGRASCRERV